MTALPANTVWRNYVIDGVPSSGPYKPDKAEIREWGTALEGGKVTPVADRTALAALDTTQITSAYLTESGREGAFVFRSSNLSTLVTADTAKGMYVAPASDTSGASGAWVRQRESLIVNPLWFGAKGDGVTDDTAAIQAAENMRASVGGELIFPPGTYQISATNITVNRANGGKWRGIGEALLRASANNTFLCVLTNAVAGTTNKPFLVSGLHFHGGGFTGCRGIHETTPYGTTITDCTFTQMAFCASFIGGSVLATQTGWLQVSNIRQYGGGSWAFYGFDDSHYLFHIELNNIHQVGTGSSTNWENDFWIEGRRAVGLSINNCWSGSLDGGADGLRLRGDCQGVFVTNATFVWPKIGINSLTWTDTLKPAYVYMSNIGVDQHTVSGAEIEGRTWFITNANFANGRDRANTGSGCLIKSTCTDIVIQDTLFAYDNRSGLVVQNGAKKIRVGNFTAENNNQVAGAFYDIDLGASPYADVRLFGRNVLGTAGVNATGQRLVNGVTSDMVSANVTPASTTAVVTAEDLMTYTIPAAALKVGQRVRVRAWGTTAANANTKTGRLWLGATNMGGWSAALNATGWEISAEIIVTGAAAETYRRVSLTTSSNVAGSTAAEAISGAIVVKFQGQNGVASAGDITCNGLEVEIVD